VGWKKWGGLLCPFGWVELGLHQIQCHLGQGLPTYQVASWSTQPFGHNRHGPKKIGEGCCAPSNTKSPGLRPSSIPSDILIHAAIWLQQIWAQNSGGGCAPLGERQLGPHLTQCGQGQGLPAYQVASWSMKPFGHNTRVLQTTETTDRQTTSHDNNRTFNATVG